MLTVQTLWAARWDDLLRLATFLGIDVTTAVQDRLWTRYAIVKLILKAAC